MLKEAKRYLKQQQQRDAGGALVTTTTSSSSIAAAAAAVSRASSAAAAAAGAQAPPPQQLSAAAAAAAKVAAARAAALEEDAFLANMGAPRESLLSFRGQGLGSFAVAEDGARDSAAGAGPKGVGPSASNKRWMKEEAKERLEEIAPKATGRDALMEKRAAARQSNRDAAAAADDAMLGGMLGDELGGGDDFKAAMARQRRGRPSFAAEPRLQKRAYTPRFEAHHTVLTLCHASFSLFCFVFFFVLSPPPAQLRKPPFTREHSSDPEPSS